MFGHVGADLDSFEDGIGGKAVIVLVLAENMWWAASAMVRSVTLPKFPNTYMNTSSLGMLITPVTAFVIGYRMVGRGKPRVG